MSDDPCPMTLCGRAEEKLVIDRLLASAREGRSGTLVLRGRMGIGKSALLEYGAQAASGMRVLRATGVETEAEFPFAGLHMLLLPALDRIEALPGPQAAALRRAFGDCGEEGADDQFLLGLAVLSLLSELAEEQPLLCLVDDAQWLDTASAQALLFVARRLDAEGVALIIAAREQPTPSALPLPPALYLAGLDETAAGQLLDQRAPSLPPGWRDRVLAEAAGNPLAVVELARAAARDPVARAGPGPLPGDERVREVFRAQLRQLADPARMLLLLGAAESTGDLTLVLAAAQKLGIEPAALDAAERADVVRVSAGRLEFRHPLLRSAAYHSASPAGRRLAHRALAQTLAGGTLDEADRRAWHLAAAAAGPDEPAAAELETVAERSRSRGGYAAVAAAYERAADLTPDPRARAGRLAAAATAANDAGQLDRAAKLAARAAELGGDDLLHARLALLRVNMPTADRARHIAALPAAAALIAGREPELAAVMLIRASHSAWSGHDGALAVKAAAQLRELSSVTGEDSFAGAFAIQALLVVGDQAADSRTVADYLAETRQNAAGKSPDELLTASNMAFWAGDHDATWEISAALAAGCRRDGMAGWLPGALQGLAMAQHQRGEWAGARASALEGLRLAADTGQQPRAAFMSGMLSWLAAHEGDEDGFLSWVTGPDGRVPDSSSPVGARLWFHQGRALMDLADERYASACEHLEQASQWWDAGTAFACRPDLAEAAIRSGKAGLARAESAAFDAWASQVGRRWARAVALRCRALVSAYGDGSDDAGAHYATAIRLHDGAGRPFEQARTHLAYGEWLRGNRRRVTARGHLSAALDIFEDLGAAGWARRALAELSAAGGQRDERPARPKGVLSELTAQEFQVASLAAQGLSNRDIAAQLFLSPRTVGYHLYKAYPKLDVTSRGELAALFGTGRAD